MLDKILPRDKWGENRALARILDTLVRGEKTFYDRYPLAAMGLHHYLGASGKDLILSRDTVDRMYHDNPAWSRYINNIQINQEIKNLGATLLPGKTQSFPLQTDWLAPKDQYIVAGDAQYLLGHFSTATSGIVTITKNADGTLSYDADYNVGVYDVYDFDANNQPAIPRLGDMITNQDLHDMVEAGSAQPFRTLGTSPEIHRHGVVT